MTGGPKTVEGVEGPRAHETDQGEEAYLGDGVVVKCLEAGSLSEPLCRASGNSRGTIVELEGISLLEDSFRLHRGQVVGVEHRIRMEGRGTR